jgi:hypothetical protein
VYAEEAHRPRSRPSDMAEPTPSVTDRHIDFGKPLFLGPSFAAHVRELPAKIRELILDTGVSGGFLGRPTSEPLPMDWRSE